MRIALLCSCLCLLLSAALAQGPPPAQYQFVAPKSPLPTAPWHRTFIDETAKTPADQPNAGAAWTDFFLQAAFDHRLQTTAAQVPWEQCSSFFQWAVWAYLSPDSKFHGDERLLAMSQTWLDTLFTALQTKPADPAAAAKWQPDRLDTWSFTDYSLPLLEVEARPNLKAKLGADRLDRLRQIVLANIELNTT